MSNNKIEKNDWQEFAHNFQLAEQLRGKVIGITGATGLLGACMVHCLQTLNQLYKLQLEIVCIVRNAEKAKNMFDNVTVISHDFSLGSNISKDVRLNYLIHFASPTASQYFINNPVETMVTDFGGTQQILELAKATGISSLVNVSSLEVYGTIYDDAEALSEEQQGYIDPMQVRSSYPIAKRAAESLCHAYAKEYQVHAKTARLAQTFGAGVTPDDNRVFAQFARNVIAGQDIVLHTTGELSRCYCYTTDAIEAILYILLKGEDGEAYNVANEDTYISIIDMAKFLCQTFNPTIKPIIKIKEGMGYSPMTKLRLSCKKIHQLGWTPRHDLKTMFSKLIQSMKD